LITYSLSMSPRKMHQTTVRFGADLWEALEEECAQLGVSVAQFLREAALARLVYAAGKRGDDEFDLALDLVSGAEPSEPPFVLPKLETMAAPALTASTANERSLREASEAAALAAQSKLVRQRARELRARAALRRQAR
jgi:hypothetical protein